MSYDTINMTFQSSSDQIISAMTTSPEYRNKLVKNSLDESNISTSISGKVNNLNVFIREHEFNPEAQVYISGSLAKFHLGTNATTLTRSETEKAVQHLSDIFHCDLGEAKIRGRLDIGKNLIMKYPPSKYFNLMQSAPYMQRAYIGDTVYFQNGKRKLAFYDKCEELVRSKTDIPECFSGRNVLRFEHRIIKGLPKQLKKPEVLCKDLYCEKVYSELVKTWKQAYYSVKKQKEGVFLNMKNKKEFFDDLAFHGVLSMSVENVKNQIQSAYKAGIINRQQKHRRLSELNEITTSENKESTSDLIKELDKKVEMASRYAR